MAPDVDDLTHVAREMWTAVAPAWERYAQTIARMSAPAQRWLIDRLDPKPDETILELGAGPGDVGFEIASLLGPDGRLLSTDISQDMVSTAQRRAPDASNIEFRTMDAQAIDLPDRSVNGVVHRFGPMLLPDPEASFREVRRVLSDGGRYVTAIWPGPEHNAWIVWTPIALMQHGIELPALDPNGPGGIFSLADPDVLRSRIEATGLEVVELEPVDQPFDLSADEVWALVSGVTPLAAVFRSLSDDQIAAVRGSIDEMSAQHKTGDRYLIPARSICVLAR